MKTTFVSLAASCGLAFLTANSAHAFSITSVSLSPSEPVDLTEVSLIIDIVTPSQGTWLYAPTEVTSSATGFHIDVYPTSGLLPATGTLRESATLGALPAGTYNYEVVIHPSFTVNWGTRTNRGSFVVMPGAPVVRIETIDPATSEPYDSGIVVPGKFLISRTGSTENHLRVFLEYSGSASNGVDYRELPPWFVEIPAGHQSAVLDIVGLKDELVEGKETVDVRVLEGPPDDFPLLIPIQEYRVDPNRQSGRVILFDRQTPIVIPTLRIEATVAEAGECAPNADCAFVFGRYRIHRTGELDYPLAVYVGIEGTAIRGVDYRLILPDPSQQGFSHFLMLPAGESDWELVVDPIDDRLAEDNETATLRLLLVDIDTSHVFPPADYLVDSAHDSATVLIHDNDPSGRPVVSLEGFDPDAAETLLAQNNIDWAEFRVLRTGSVTEELVVFLNPNQGSARLGEDYRLDGLSDRFAVRFLGGMRSVTIRLYPIDDDFYEGDETSFIHLIAPSASDDPYEIEHAHSSVALVIHDNDPVTTRLDITAPRHGQHFQAGDIIQLRAQIIGPSIGDSWVVEFLDGEQQIGTTRLGGTIFWNDAIGGPHLIQARATNSNGDSLTARPVSIQVGPGPAWPVVSLVHRWITAEPCPTCLVTPGIFIFSRTGPVAEPLTVYFETDGTATSGVDYERLPHSVTIPAGTNSTEVLVLPFDDQLVEGPEVVRASIARPPEMATLGYIVNVHASEAFVVIHDDEEGAPEARLDIIEPQEGTQFASGTVIQLSALGVYTRGEVFQPVEFYAGGRLIGRSSPDQPLRPSIPSLPSVHTIWWTNAPAGEHVLTARSQLSLDQWVEAPPVRIRVGAREDPTLGLIDGCLHVRFVAETGFNYRVEASSDFENWEIVFRGKAVDGALNFVEEEMQFPHRFYRLVPEAANPAE